MVQIFFKKGEQRPSVFSTLGILTTFLAVIALLIVGPAYRLSFLTPDVLDPADTELRVKLLHVATRLAIVAAMFTLAGFLHGASSPRVRVSWRALTALTLLIPIGYASWVFEGWIAYSPESYDISTSPSDPPAFSALIAELPEAEETTGKTAQEGVYRDLLPITLSVDQQAATRQAQATVEKLGWQIVRTDESAGIIEARRQSRWFGFESLIVIRVREKAAASILDIRSVSRLGTPDMGNNVRVIRKFRDALTARSG
jgi:uncharacterized protein (DUF1499 family)